MGAKLTMKRRRKCAFWPSAGENKRGAAKALGKRCVESYVEKYRNKSMRERYQKNKENIVLELTNKHFGG